MNKRGITFLMLAVVATTTATAQFIPTAQNARLGALGGCHIPYNADRAQLGIAWHQGYMAQGFATKHIEAATPLGKRWFTAAHYSHFGDTAYHEQQGTLAVGIRASEWLSIAIYGIYSHIGTGDAHYRQQHWLDAGATLQAIASKTFAAYLTAFSRRWDTGRPWGGYFSLSYRPAPQLRAVAELASENRLRFRCGMEYIYEEHLAARIGLASNPMTMTFGIGYTERHYQIDLATEVHPTLGPSPQISLSLCL